jgi:hypothetical protein
MTLSKWSKSVVDLHLQKEKEQKDKQGPIKHYREQKTKNWSTNIGRQ